MAELKEGQQIIFKHPANGGIRVGSYSIGWVSYCVSGFPTDVPFSENYRMVRRSGSMERANLTEYTEPEQQYNEAIDDLAKIFGFKP